MRMTNVEDYSIFQIESGKNPQLAHLIMGWLYQLANMLAAKEGRVTRQTLITYTEMLIRDFPSQIFSAESLHYIVHNFTWWPSYPELQKHLQQYQRIKEPNGAAYEDEALAFLTKQEQLLVKIFYANEDKHWRYPEDKAMPSLRCQQTRKSLTLDVLRCCVPKVYEYLIQEIQKTNKLSSRVDQESMNE